MVYSELLIFKKMQRAGKYSGLTKILILVTILFH